MSIYEKRKITSSHLIYVSTGCATSEQLALSVDKALKEAEKEFGSLPTQYCINIPTNRFGQTIGFGYVWFTNPEIALMLSGKNIDGTNRIEQVPKQDWTSKNPELTDLSNDILKFINTVNSMFDIGRLPFDDDSYTSILERLSDEIPCLKDSKMNVITDGFKIILDASVAFGDSKITDTIEEILNLMLDMNDEESWAVMDEMETKCTEIYNNLLSLLSPYIRPYIESILPALITLPPYRYTEDQIKMKLQEAYLRGETLDTDTISTEGTFQVSPAYANSADDNSIAHELYCNNVPAWVDLDNLRELFLPMTSMVTKAKYPIISRTGNGLAVRIKFSKYTNDATFVLLMHKKIQLISPKNEQHTLYLAHARARKNN